jgi:hypothetical protein
MTSKSEDGGLRPRSSSANPQKTQLFQLQGVLDGVGIDLEEAKVNKTETMAKE